MDNCILIIAIGCSALRFRLVESANNTTEYYAPNPGYDAYWIGGGWVFLKNRMLSTQKPIRDVKGCRKPCAPVYLKLTGPVCGHAIHNYTLTPEQLNNRDFTHYYVDWRLGGRLDSIDPVMITYDSYCEFLTYRCMDLHKGDNQGLLRFVHFGKCLDQSQLYPNMMGYPGEEASNRKQRFLEAFNDTIDVNNLEERKKTYVRCGITDPKILYNLNYWELEWYDRIAETGRCYYIDYRLFQYTKDRCDIMEVGGALFPFNDEKERLVVFDLLQDLRDKIKTELLFIGVERPWKNPNWFTAKADEHLSRVGYAPWGPGEPAEYSNPGMYLYGTVSVEDGFYHAVPWSYLNAICIIEVNTYDEDIDEY